jgi:hypothetical protein
VNKAVKIVLACAICLAVGALIVGTVKWLAG